MAAAKQACAAFVDALAPGAPALPRDRWFRPCDPWDTTATFAPERVVVTAAPAGDRQQDQTRGPPARHS
ncbi:hypothetical protein [Streptomyces sp. NPDC058955]|uniref:hypothetical protein n=1 Tax=unclassified Streptomyces TaxID=2593676 RepID=UPI003665C54D